MLSGTVKDTVASMLHNGCYVYSGNDKYDKECVVELQTQYETFCRLWGLRNSRRFTKLEIEKKEVLLYFLYIKLFI